MRTTKIILTILTIIITLIAFIKAITVKSIDTTNDITTIALKNDNKIYYDNLNGEYWSNDIEVIKVEPTNNNSFKITLNDGSYLINKDDQYKYYN